MKSLIQSMLSYAIKKWEICWSLSAFDVINRFLFKKYHTNISTLVTRNSEVIVQLINQPESIKI